jgi:hypothetical protein
MRGSSRFVRTRLRNRPSCSGGTSAGGSQWDSRGMARCSTAVTANSTDIHIGAFDLSSGRATAGPPISERFVGTSYGPDWSPDGSRVSYFSRRGLPGPRRSSCDRWPTGRSARSCRGCSTSIVPGGCRTGRASSRRAAQSRDPKDSSGSMPRRAASRPCSRRTPKPARSFRPGRPIAARSSTARMPARSREASRPVRNA